MYITLLKIAFVRSFVLVDGRPRRPTTNTTTTIADRARLLALREDIFEAGQQEETYVQRSLRPKGRGGPHLGRRRGELNVVVIYCGMLPLKIPLQNITTVKNGASHIVRNKDTRLNGGANVRTTLVQNTFLLCTKAYRCTS